MPDPIYSQNTSWTRTKRRSEEVQEGSSLLWLMDLLKRRQMRRQFARRREKGRMAGVHGNHLLAGESRVRVLLEGQRVRLIATALNEHPGNPSEVGGAGLQWCPQGSRRLGDQQELG